MRFFSTVQLNKTTNNENSKQKLDSYNLIVPVVLGMWRVPWRGIISVFQIVHVVGKRSYQTFLRLGRSCRPWETAGSCVSVNSRIFGKFCVSELRNLQKLCVSELRNLQEVVCQWIAESAESCVLVNLGICEKVYLLSYLTFVWIAEKVYVRLSLK